MCDAKGIMNLRSAVHRVCALLGVALVAACSPDSGGDDASDPMGCELGGKCDDTSTEPEAEMAVCVTVASVIATIVSLSVAAALLH